MRSNTSFNVLVFTIILFMGVGCSNQISGKQVQTDDARPAPPKSQIDNTVMPTVITQEVTSQLTRLPSPTSTSIQIKISATPILQIDQVCTPLADHPVEILTEIVSDPYNPPHTGTDGRHMGVDFSYYRWEGRTGIAGVPVQSILPGNVIAVLENNIPYGYAVIIETPIEKLLAEWLENTVEYEITDSIYLLYAHMQEIPLVEIGDPVQCGEQIGIVGNTGGVNTPYAIPHLHLEMRVGLPGARFAEMGFYDTRISELARQNYLTWRTSGEFRHFDPMILIKNYLVISN